jgi:hypothetical protein
MIIALKIDVSKIDKERLFKGKKGTYLDAILWLDYKEDQYGGNGMIAQQVPKDEYARGVKGNILGNCRILSSEKKEPSEPEEEFDDDIPF